MEERRRAARYPAPRTAQLCAVPGRALRLTAARPVVDRLRLAQAESDQSGVYPMVTEHEASAPTGTPVPDVLPVLPLRGGVVVFPFAVVPLAVGQPSSVQLVEAVMRGDRMLALVARR